MIAMACRVSGVLGLSVVLWLTAGIPTASADSVAQELAKRTSHYHRHLARAPLRHGWTDGARHYGMSHSCLGAPPAFGMQFGTRRHSRGWACASSGGDVGL